MSSLSRFLNTPLSSEEAAFFYKHFASTPLHEKISNSPEHVRKKIQDMITTFETTLSNTDPALKILIAFHIATNCLLFELKSTTIPTHFSSVLNFCFASKGIYYTTLSNWSPKLFSSIINIAIAFITSNTLHHSNIFHRVDIVNFVKEINDYVGMGADITTHNLNALLLLFALKAEEALLEKFPSFLKSLALQLSILMGLPIMTALYLLSNTTATQEEGSSSEPEFTGIEQAISIVLILISALYVEKNHHEPLRKEIGKARVLHHSNLIVYTAIFHILHRYCHENLSLSTPENQLIAALPLAIIRPLWLSIKEKKLLDEVKMELLTGSTTTCKTKLDLLIELQQAKYRNPSEIEKLEGLLIKFKESWLSSKTPSFYLARALAYIKAKRSNSTIQEAEFLPQAESVRLAPKLPTAAMPSFVRTAKQRNTKNSDRGHASIYKFYRPDSVPVSASQSSTESSSGSAATSPPNTPTSTASLISTPLPLILPRLKTVIPAPPGPSIPPAVQAATWASFTGSTKQVLFKPTSFYQDLVEKLSHLIKEYNQMQVEDPFLKRHVDLQICILETCCSSLEIFDKNHLSNLAALPEQLYQHKSTASLTKTTSLSKISGNFIHVASLTEQYQKIISLQNTHLIEIVKLLNHLNSLLTTLITKASLSDEILTFFASFFPLTFPADFNPNEMSKFIFFAKLHNLALDFTKKHPDYEVFLAGTRIFLPQHADDADLVIYAANPLKTDTKVNAQALEMTISHLLNSLGLTKDPNESWARDRTAVSLTYIHQEKNETSSTNINVTIYLRTSLTHFINASRGRLFNIAAVLQNLATGATYIDPTGVQALVQHQVDYLFPALPPTEIRENSANVFTLKCLTKISLPYHLGENLSSFKTLLASEPVVWLRLGKTMMDKTCKFEQIIARWTLCIVEPLQYILLKDSYSSRTFSLYPPDMNADTAQSLLKAFFDKNAGTPERGLFLILLTFRHLQIRPNRNTADLFKNTFGLQDINPFCMILAEVYRGFCTQQRCPPLKDPVATELMRLLDNYITMLAPHYRYQTLLPSA